MSKSITETAKFATKKAQLEILERFEKTLEEIREETITEYRVVGKESEQARHWKTGELLWEDEEQTIPKFRDRYANVAIPEEELTTEKRAMLVAIDEMYKALDKMV